MAIFNSYVSLPEGNSIFTWVYGGYTYTFHGGILTNDHVTSWGHHRVLDSTRTYPSPGLTLLQCAPPSDVCWFRFAPVTIVKCVP